MPAGTSGAPVVAACAAAEEVDLDAARREVAVGEERDDAARPARAAHEVAEEVAVAEREDLQADAGPEREELLEHLLGLEALGDREDGREVARRPRAGEVPVPLVRQGEHRAALAVEVVADVVLVDDAHARRDLLRRPRGQGERLAVVAHVRPHPGPRQAPQLARAQPGAHARQVLLELAHAAAVQEPGDVGDGGEQTPQDRVGHLGRGAPRDGEGLAGVEPHRQRAPSVSSGRPPPARARAWRRTVAMRCTIVTALARASSPSTTTSTTGGTPSPTIPAATSAATSRSARSAMPTCAVMPTLSARARA